MEDKLNVCQWVCILLIVLKFAVLGRCEMNLALPFPPPGCIQWWLVFALSLGHSQGQKRRWWLTDLCLSAVGMIPPAMWFVQMAGTGTVITLSERATLFPLDWGGVARSVSPCGTWMLSWVTGPLSRVIAFRQLVCWLSYFWRLGDKLQHRSKRWLAGGRLSACWGRGTADTQRLAFGHPS